MSFHSVRVNGMPIIPGFEVATGYVGKFPDGTAGVPSVTFASDLTKGFYSGGSNQVRLALAGTFRHGWFAGTYHISNDAAEIDFGVNSDAILIRTGANALAMRNGANAQTWAVGPASAGVTLVGASTGGTVGVGGALPLNLTSTHVNLNSTRVQFNANSTVGSTLSAAAFGNVGGPDGPATQAQYGWEKHFDSSGGAYFCPTWR